MLKWKSKSILNNNSNMDFLVQITQEQLEQDLQKALSAMVPE